MDNKRNLGQYFTKGDAWLLPQVVGFISQYSQNGILDPYAGGGDLLKHFDDTKGFDVDPSLGWPVNDSLTNIPATGRLVITNPPYLAKNSAKRRGLDSYKYFKDTTHQDLFMIGLEKCLENHNQIVAIIPETFLNKGRFEKYVESFSILEENPFEDTQTPTCVVCLNKNGGDYKIYVNDKYIGVRDALSTWELTPSKDIEISFNNPKGNGGVLGYDINKLGNDIIFCTADEARLPHEVKYTDRATSRFYCARIKDINTFNIAANKLLNEYRQKTGGIFLMPYKNNRPNGTRRRGLSMSQMRVFIELTIRYLEW